MATNAPLPGGFHGLSMNKLIGEPNAGRKQKKPKSGKDLFIPPGVFDNDVEKRLRETSVSSSVVKDTQSPEWQRLKDAMDEAGFKGADFWGNVHKLKTVDKDVRKAYEDYIQSGGTTTKLSEVEDSDIARHIGSVGPLHGKMRKAVNQRDIFQYQSLENQLREASDLDRELPQEAPDPEAIKRSKRRNQSRRGGRRSTLLTSGMGMGGSGYGLGG